jgi:hypothetical protein
MLELSLMGPNDETTNSPSDAPFVLPKHIRFARSLALVSGAVIGIAAGAAVFGSGCQTCAGICGSLGVQPAIDAEYDTSVDHPGDRADGAVDADAREVTPDGHAGGGPCPAPRLPADWLV